MQHGLPSPSNNDLDNYSVNSAGDLDVIYEPLYDYVTYSAAGQSSLSFFQNPIGQLGKTFEDTNMESAGQLPAPQKFIVKAICIDFFPGNVVSGAEADANLENWNDTYNVMKSGWLEFKVGIKPRLRQAPVGAFPSTYRLAGTSALTGTPAGAGVVAGVDYASMAGQVFNIIPVTIPQNQNFSVTLNWNTPVPITTDARIGVKLMGNLYRSVQ